MFDLNGIKLIYTHPSKPPEDMDITCIHTLCEDWRGIYVTNGNKIFDIPYEIIKILFHPVNCSWKEIERGIK